MHDDDVVSLNLSVTERQKDMKETYSADEKDKKNKTCNVDAMLEESNRNEQSDMADDAMDSGGNRQQHTNWGNLDRGTNMLTKTWITSPCLSPPTSMTTTMDVETALASGG